MNFREILFIGCVVLVLTVCILGFVGSFFRSPQQYEVVSIDSLKLPAALDMKYSPQSPKEFITLEKRAAVEEFYADTDSNSEKVIEEKIEKVYQHISQKSKNSADAAKASTTAQVTKPVTSAKKKPAPVLSKPKKVSKKSTIVSTPRKVRKKATPPVVKTTKPAPKNKIIVKKKSIKAGTAGTKPVVASAESSQTAVKYTVQKGDTLFAVSKKFGVSRQQIANDNNIQTDSELIIGQILKLAVSGKVLKNKSVKGTYMVHHILAAGETISSVAKHYGVPVSDVIQANKNRVKNINVVVKGQELLVPVK